MTQITHYAMPNIKPATIVQDMRDMHDEYIDDQITWDQLQPVLTSMFDFALPHFESLSISDQEFMTNVAEWLDRLHDLPNV